MQNQACKNEVTVEWYCISLKSVYFYINCLLSLIFSQHANDFATIRFIRVFEWLLVFILIIIVLPSFLWLFSLSLEVH